MKAIFIIITLFLQAPFLLGQETFKEIKSLTKQHRFQVGDKIKVSGERTFVTITTWDKNEVEARVEVISRFKDRARAKKDLEVIKVNFEKKGDEVIFSNAIQVDNQDDRPQSNLKTNLHLSVPSYAIVEIRNSFGQLDLDGEIEAVTVDTKFCSTKINNYSGSLKVFSRYGDVDISNSNGNVNVKTNRSDLSLLNVAGDIEVDMTFGKLDIRYSEESLDYNVKTKYTPISVFISEDSEVFQDITCKNCDLVINNCDAVTDETIAKKKHHVTIGSEDNQKATSKIKSELEDVTVISVNTQN